MDHSQKQIHVFTHSALSKNRIDAQSIPPPKWPGSHRKNSPPLDRLSSRSPPPFPLVRSGDRVPDAHLNLGFHNTSDVSISSTSVPSHARLLRDVPEPEHELFGAWRVSGCCINARVTSREPLIISSHAAVLNIPPRLLFLRIFLAVSLLLHDIETVVAWAAGTSGTHLFFFPI